MSDAAACTHEYTYRCKVAGRWGIYCLLPPGGCGEILETEATGGRQASTRPVVKTRSVARE